MTAGDRARAKPAPAILQDGPAETRKVGGGREDARVTGDAAQRARILVVDHATKGLPDDNLRGGAVPPGRGRRPKTGGVHAHRDEYLPGGEIGQRLAGDPLNERAQDDKARIAVLESFARAAHKRLGEAHGERFVAASTKFPIGAMGGQARGMQQEALDGDGAPCAPAELREEAPERIAQAQFAQRDKPHHARRSGDHLGQRGDVEKGVGPHGAAFGGEHAPADGLAQEDSPRSPDHAHRPGGLAAGHGAAKRAHDLGLNVQVRPPHGPGRL